MVGTNNAVVDGTTSRHLPFGGYRTAPTDPLTDRGFTGHKQNDDIGLIYMNARYYVSGIGRFASADTIIPDPMIPQAFNRYSYVYNNPINFNDPSGHAPQEPIADIDGWTIGLATASAFVMAMQHLPDDVHFDWDRVASWQRGNNEDMWAVHAASEEARKPENTSSSIQKEIAGSTSSSPGDFDPNDPDNESDIQFNISDKIEKQLEKRGWSQNDINNIIENPYHTSPATNRATQNPATAYFDSNGAYVVRDNVTDDIIQISNKFDPHWIPDESIINPYIP